LEKRGDLCLKTDTNLHNWQGPCDHATLVGLFIDGAIYKFSKWPTYSHCRAAGSPREVPASCGHSKRSLSSWAK